MVFILSALWAIRIRGLWKLPDQIDWQGETGSCSDGWGYAQYLFNPNFSWWGLVVYPLCCLTWGQTVVEIINIMVTYFKRSHACTATLSAPDPAAGHCQSMPLPEIPGLSQASLGQSLVGSLLLSLGSWCTQGFVYGFQVLFPQSYVSSGGSMVGLMVTSSKRAYAIPSSAAPRAPASAADHCWLIPLQETLKHSKAGLIQSLWGLLVCTRFCLSPLSILAGMGFDSKRDFIPPTILLGLLLCPWTWGMFFWWEPTFSCWWLSSSQL